MMLGWLAFVVVCFTFSQDRQNAHIARLELRIEELESEDQDEDEDYSY